ncbi:MAG TPA: carbon-nitrogen hydrolase family protein [Pseudolabrys sp.]|nr:carbon-nitrogen hydrolase family protein [Pseudolabrys sp.]
MSFRIAVVQPLANPIEEDSKNVADAEAFIARAAAGGAHFVCLPETYPGPWRMPATFDPGPAMAAAASRHGIHVVYGTIAPIPGPGSNGAAYNLICMAYPDGRTVQYRRTHPNGPWIYTGGEWWEFQYVAGDEFPVFDTAHGKVGLAMCSEVYMPEVARALALRGAEIIFMPAGTDKRRLWATWRNLIWARAIENLALVVTTQNLFSHAERGLAMVATPEEILFESTAAGLFTVDVDLTRLREMRTTTDDVASAKGYGAKQGVLGPQWQRPELRDVIYPRQRHDAAE